MPLECDKCRSKIPNKDYLACAGCKKKFHLDCISVSEKRFLLMTKEHKANWECRKCIVKKSKNREPASSNVTLRKQNQKEKPKQNSSPDTSAEMGNTIHCSNFSANETANRSCPENLTVALEEEEKEELKRKISHLESRLESADSEIERLVAETFSLKELLSKRDAKINQLLHICRSTPQRNNYKDTKGVTESTSTTKIPAKNSPTNSSTPIQTKEQQPETLLHKTSNSGQSPPTTVSEKTPKEPSTPKQAAPTTGATELIAKENKNKMCILSTNRFNETLKIAQHNFEDSYNLCHYLLPNRGLQKLLQGIESKVADFNENDFVIILIGEEDFNHTENYHDLILHVRECLQKINHTNILLCVPTFKQGRRTTDIFNSRVEIFNKILCMDVIRHKYAFLIDSNLNLSYDNTMFYTRNGKINNYGIKQVFQDIKENISLINSWYSDDDNASTYQDNHTYNNNESQIFFRDNSI